MIYFLSVVCVWGVSQWLWIQKETQLKWRQSFVYELEFKKSFPKPFSQSSYSKSTWWIGRVFPPFTGEHTAWRFTQSLQFFSVEDLGLGTVPLASKLGFLIFSARPCALWLFIFIFIILHTLFAVLTGELWLFLSDGLSGMFHPSYLLRSDMDPAPLGTTLFHRSADHREQSNQSQYVTCSSCFSKHN